MFCSLLFLIFLLEEARCIDTGNSGLLELAGECPSGWIDSPGGCYLFHVTRNGSWAEANQECELLGGFLAEPKRKEEAEFLTIAAKVEESMLGERSWWIGLSDMSHEGRWFWMHSLEDLEYSHWAPGSPRGTEITLDCGLMDPLSEYGWTDMDCVHTSASPICQIESVEFSSTTTTTTTTTTTSTTATTTKTTTTTSKYPGELLYEDEEYAYYKATVNAGTTMIEGSVPDTCEQYGMVAVCSGPYPGCFYSSDRCTVTSLSTECDYPMYPLSKIICGGEYPSLCPAFEKVFAYNHGYGGECGSVNGEWCYFGDNWTAGDEDTFAYCGLAKET